jgi:anti-sigma B factor antagonist
MSETTRREGLPAVYRPELRKIDLLNSEAFHASLLEYLREGGSLVLDLSEVQFIDSSGLGKIVSALRSFRERGGDMRLCSVQAPVMVLFSMVRLGEIIGIDADAEASSRELAKGA